MLTELNIIDPLNSAVRFVLAFDSPYIIYQIAFIDGFVAAVNAKLDTIDASCAGDCAIGDLTKNLRDIAPLLYTPMEDIIRELVVQWQADFAANSTDPIPDDLIYAWIDQDYTTFAVLLKLNCAYSQLDAITSEMLATCDEQVQTLITYSRFCFNQAWEVWEIGDAVDD